jgi:hypothetical protein
MSLPETPIDLTQAQNWTPKTLTTAVTNTLKILEESKQQHKGFSELKGISDMTSQRVERECRVT